MKINLNAILLKYFLLLAAVYLCAVLASCSTVSKVKNKQLQTTDSTSAKKQSAATVTSTDSTGIKKTDSTHREKITVNFSPFVVEIGDETDFSSIDTSAVNFNNGTAEEYTAAPVAVKKQDMVKPGKKKQQIKTEYRYQVAGKNIVTSQPVQSITFEVDGRKTETQFTDLTKKDSTGRAAAETTAVKKVIIQDGTTKKKTGISWGKWLILGLIVLIILVLLYARHQLNKRIF